jgi:hypothetical protein
LIVIVESTDFESDSASALTEYAKARLFTEIANHPFSGQPMADFPGLWEGKFEGHTVIYGISSDFREIRMVMFIVGGGGGGTDHSGRGKVKELLSWLVKGGVFTVGKKVGELLLDLLLKRSLAPDMQRLLSR